MSEIAVRLKNVLAASDAYRQTMARLVGLGVPETTILVHLLHEGPRTPSALARRVGVTPATVTAQLDRLELAGHVVRRSNPRDRRSVLVVLTDRGHDLAARLFALFDRDVATGIGEADPTVTAELGRILEHLSQRLDERARDTHAIAADLEESGLR
ncbi:MarR family transcriptional regulator [Pseudonocardia sp. NPDC049154]|uniref:MarR family winged helix-turn-helix transcriptional regulator n=1 Tax=Pseudonocardia sp. NPDC049154 TaxID=3155501 RepID=UPI0033F566BE